MNKFLYSSITMKQKENKNKNKIKKIKKKKNYANIGGACLSGGLELSGASWNSSKV